MEITGLLTKQFDPSGCWSSVVTITSWMLKRFPAQGRTRSRSLRVVRMAAYIYRNGRPVQLNGGNWSGDERRILQCTESPQLCKFRPHTESEKTSSGASTHASQRDVFNVVLSRFPSFGFRSNHRI
jgi:hypothetical protein